ncbi:MAG: hydroxymethylglutaryl-CoA reductase, degradative [Flavobacteriaceae bacterium]|nr:hydroxymethylglutaryl-CoA reductase, degradative [Flavobacteriaceae bacterium]
MKNVISGFSKLTKEQKIDWLCDYYSNNPEETKSLLNRYNNSDPDVQKIHDEFIENTLSNYYMPFAIAPNFLIDQKVHAIPMAIEESSVVAAASKAAKFWLNRGGFKTEVIQTEKVGQIHLTYSDNPLKLKDFFESHKHELLESTAEITKNMQARGGGILDMKLVDKTAQLEGYFQIHMCFETLDAMGANFINSCLEQVAKTFETLADQQGSFESHKPKVVMSILSNYVPNCLVRAEVSCPIEELKENDIDGQEFAENFLTALQIAHAEPYRAVTHNKGIMNGIDSVVIATGNDFRAVEAGVHAYAAKNGSYQSLTHAKIEKGNFHFWIELPLALGTVGGLTKLHPLVRLALGVLGNPNAKELMKITAVAGLAQNFAAVKSLVTTGIQKGHMKMHLLNILNGFGATTEEKNKLVVHFKNETVSNAAVQKALEELRK